jgi:pSer/pThr/pTyr-binding forkhead associated (FHA) protein
MTGALLLIIRVALVVTLYVFLGWALITLWQGLREQKRTSKNQQTPKIWLKVQIGESIQHHQIRGREIIFGRDPTCECVLPSDTVSARHARLSFRHAQWWLEDLQSTNGSFLNGETVTVPVVVAPGDQIRCGEVLLSIPEEKEA